MFDSLGGGDQHCIQCWCILGSRHDLLAFLDDTVDGRAGLAARWLLKDIEHLLKALDMGLRLLLMGFKGLAEPVGLRTARHIWQGFQDLALGIIDIIQRLVEQVL